MNSAVTCQNYFRLPQCSCEVLINLKMCIKEANLPSLAAVPIYCSVSLKKKKFWPIGSLKKELVLLFIQMLSSESTSTTAPDFLYSLGSSCNSYCCRKGDPFQGPKLGSCLTLRKELSEETRADKARDFIGKGTWVKNSRVREPRRTALPRGSQSRVLR